ncbi:MAG: hypothetical protein R3E58_13780 [Phycisphaerae bacterium]
MMHKTTQKSALIAILFGGLMTGCHDLKTTWSDSHMPDSDEVTFKVQSFTPTEGPSAGESFPYAVHLPKNYSADKRWPALLFLHGLGERGSDGVKHTTVGLGKAIRENPDRFPCVVIMPQCPDDRRWTGAMEPVVMSILDAAMNEYSIDPDRVVLTGLSMGDSGRGRSAGLIRIASRRLPQFVVVANHLTLDRSHRFRSGVSMVTMTMSSRRIARVKWWQPSSRRREHQVHRIPRRQPQLVGPDLRRRGSHRLDA